MDTFKLLQTLTEMPGPSGYESDIAATIQEMWAPLTDEIYSDRMGNLLALKKGRGGVKAGQDRRPRIMLAAHMDEIGLIVSNVLTHNRYGFLRVGNVGGVDIRHLYDQQVMVHGWDEETGRSKNLRGVLASIPGRMLPEEKHGQPYDLETLVVDTGLSAETLKKYVSVGDIVSFYQPLRELQNGRVAGKALDNRCSVAAVTHCLELLQNRHHDWDVLAAATVQEEVGLRGAFTSGFSQQPDLAIAIDVTFGSGPGTSGDMIFDLGGGPVISYTADAHPGVSAGLKEAAKTIEMKTQSDYTAAPGGTDAYALQTARAGIPTGLLGIPLRYMHTMVETITKKDVERTGRLMAAYIAQLDSNTIDQLTAGLMEDN